MGKVKDQGSPTVPASRLFHERLICLSNLDTLGFKEWIFLPAMLFGSSHKWWGDLGQRQRPHEGLDFRFYRTNGGTVSHVTEDTKIPAIFEGEIMKAIDDFLGESIFIRHSTHSYNDSQLYTIYGHIKPDHHIRPGVRVREGDVIGAIAKAGNSRLAIPPHLHISVAWVRNAVHVRELGWEMMNEPTNVVLIDPLTVIECPYSIVPNL